mmetsp:Transcript_496/g.1455  ORF Transcript_496/g.1455 Transcript_496/m.1455 type:complete len:218 (-) Transcript_496:1896-2549(-)
MSSATTRRSARRWGSCCTVSHGGCTPFSRPTNISPLGASVLSSSPPLPDTRPQWWLPISRRWTWHWVSRWAPPLRSPSSSSPLWCSLAGQSASRSISSSARSPPQSPFYPHCSSSSSCRMGKPTGSRELCSSSATHSSAMHFSTFEHHDGALGRGGGRGSRLVPAGRNLRPTPSPSALYCRLQVKTLPLGRLTKCELMAGWSSRGHAIHTVHAWCMG